MPLDLGDTSQGSLALAEEEDEQDARRAGERLTHEQMLDRVARARAWRQRHRGDPLPERDEDWMKEEKTMSNEDEPLEVEEKGLTRSETPEDVHSVDALRHPKAVPCPRCSRPIARRGRAAHERACAAKEPHDARSPKPSAARTVSPGPLAALTALAAAVEALPKRARRPAAELVAALLEDR